MPITPHTHNGTDSPQVFGGDLFNAPREAMTTADDDAFTTGGVNNLKTADATILDNMRTRINELETALRDLGLIK